MSSPFILMWLAIYITFIFSSIVFIPGNLNDGFWIPKEFVFVAGSFFVIASSFFKESKLVIRFSNIWFSFLLLTSLFSFCFFFYIPIIFNSPNGTIAWNVWNFRPTMNILLGIFLIKTLVENGRELKNWINLSKVLCWMGFLYSIYAILQWFGIDQIFRYNYDWVNTLDAPLQKNIHMVTFMSNKFLTSNYIALLAPLCLMFKDFRYKLFYLIMFIAVCMADSTISTIAFIFTFLLYLLLTKNFKALIPCIFLGIALFVFLSFKYPTFLNFTGRTVLWTDAIRAIFLDFRMFFTGRGLGSFPGHYLMGELKALSAHNEYIQMFFEGGILLLVIFFGYIISLFKRIMQEYFKDNSQLLIVYTLGLISFLIISAAGFPLRIAPLALIGVLYVACLERLTQKELGEIYG